MSTPLRRLLAALLLAAFVAFDLWFAGERCQFSPPVDWSRLGFGLVVQALAVVVLLLDNALVDALREKAATGLVVLCLVLPAVATFLMVRNAVLFGDSVDPQRKHDSSGYLCPGMR
jgi:hypothetical protein